MKNSAFEQMYSGERGRYDSVPLDKEWEKISDIRSDCYDKMEELLKEHSEIKKVFDQLMEATDTLGAIEADSYYKEGFRFGLLLGVECVIGYKD